MPSPAERIVDYAHSLGVTSEEICSVIVPFLEELDEYIYQTDLTAGEITTGPLHDRWHQVTENINFGTEPSRYMDNKLDAKRDHLFGYMLGVLGL